MRRRDEAPPPDHLCEALAAALILASGISLSIAEEQFVYPVVFAAALLTAFWTRQYASTPMRRRGLERGQKWLAGAATAWLLYEWFYLDRAEVVTLGHFVMLLCSIIVLSRRTTRDMTILLILALLLLVIGAIVSSNLGFGVAVVLFVLLFPYALARHIRHVAAVRFAAARETIRAEAESPHLGTRPEPPPHGVALLLGSLRCSAVALVIGALLFFAFPRFGAQIGQWRTNSGTVVTGDSTDVIVGDTGNVQSRDRPVMRVWLERNGEVVGSRDLTPYFRSGAMDRYESRGPGRFEWTRSRAPNRRSLELGSREALDLIAAAAELDTDESDWLDQHYEFLSRASRRLYAVYPAMAFESEDIETVARSTSDQAVFAPGGANARGLRYLVRSPWRMNANMARLVTQQNAALRLGALSDAGTQQIPGEIAPIARRIARITADDGDPATRRQAAERIREYLTSDEFEYTLELRSGPRNVDPIVYFLTDLRRGHCQYFASAMVLMCQSLGIPARVAVGYSGGDYNKVGGYFLVRESHAHAWAEVYVPGEDWVAFDPSPSQFDDDDSTGWLAWVKSVVQLAQYEWITRIVAFDREQRRRVLSDLLAWFTPPSLDAAGPLRRALAAISGLRSAQPSMHALLVALAAAGTLGLILALRLYARIRRRSRRDASRFTRRPDAGFIAEALEKLTRLGFHRRPSQTPQELVDSIPAAHAAQRPSRQLVNMYYRTQYGAHAVTAEDASEIRRWMEELLQVEHPHDRPD